MKLERIGENQLRVSLNDEDLTRLGLSYETLDYQNEQTRRVFWEIMQTAKEEQQFDAFHCKIVLEAIPKPEGVVLLVTREGQPDNLLSVKSTLSFRKQNKAQPHIKTAVFSFETLEELLHCCESLPDDAENSFLSSSLYSMQERFYLVLDYPCIFSSSQPTALWLFHEFGTREDESSLALLLCEHGQPVIVACALETLQNTFLTAPRQTQ